jgi:hypothetical protein
MRSRAVEGLGLFRGGICLDVLGSGDQTLVIGGARMQVNNGTPSPFVGVDVGQLQRALIIGGNHGDAARTRAARRPMAAHRPNKHGDMLVADLAVNPMRSNQAGLRAVLVWQKRTNIVVVR